MINFSSSYKSHKNDWYKLYYQWITKFLIAASYNACQLPCDIKCKCLKLPTYKWFYVNIPDIIILFIADYV